MSEADIQLARARQLVGMRRYEEAMKVLAPAIVETETAAVGLCLLAQCQLSLGQPGAAEASARRALGAGATGEWPHRAHRDQRATPRSSGPGRARRCRGGPAGA